MKLLQGDCIDILKTLEDNSIDAIVTDPPAGISFMGKSWDTDKGGRDNWIKWMQEVATECKRVLKPGGHAFVWAIPRTSHWTATAWENAGFEIRDVVAHVFGSGFPKSLNIGKSVNQLETNEWSKISKAFDNVDQKSIMEVWKTNAKLAGIKLVKNLTGVGSNTRRKYFVHDIAVLYFNQEKENASAITAELNLCVPSRTSEENLSIAVGSVEQNTELSQNLVKSVVKLSENQRAKSWNIFTAQCDVKEFLNENTDFSHKVDEALKTLRGNKKYSNEEITSVLCAVIPSVLKLTILNQSKTFQNLDTNQKMECASAINVIITEYTVENLISNTVAILKSKAVDKLQGNEREDLGEHPNPAGNKAGGNSLNMSAIGMPETATLTKGTSEWEGWGTALKPAREDWILMRKPIEGTVAENCLKWGVGGINIDGCRISHNEETKTANRKQRSAGWNPDNCGFDSTNNTVASANPTGRFPANLCWTCSCEPHYLTGSVLFDILNIISNQIKLCLLKNSSSNVQSVEKKKSLQDMTSEEKMLCFAVENVDTPTLERILGKTLEVIFNEDIECSVEMLEKSMNTSLSISLSGNEKMEEYQKVLKYITLTATNLITELKTYKLSQSQIIGSFITKVISGIQEQSQVKSHSPNCEVVELFPNTVPTSYATQNTIKGGMFGMPGHGTEKIKDTTRSAARFFYCAKASKSERNRGCEGLEEKEKVFNGQSDKPSADMKDVEKRFTTLPKANFHPTVKPIALMEYLIKLVSREGHTILDPFMGSGTTGIACKKLNRHFIGIEREPDYITIAENRIEAVPKTLF